jgi:hypothetical protein
MTTEIYVLNTNDFVRSGKKNSLRAFKNRVLRISRSTGPDEVWNSLKNPRLFPAVRVIKRNPRTWPDSDSYVVIVRSYLYDIPEKLLQRLKDNYVFLGPNIDFSLSANRELINTFPRRKFLVPSEWVINYATVNWGVDSHELLVWGAGIDSEKWAPSGSQYERPLVLFYIKSKRFEVLSNSYYELLIAKGFQIQFLHYGEYAQETYIKQLKRTKFMIFFGDTESQGLAMFQAWAMNVPTLVINVNKLDHLGRTFEASSGPYLNLQTGSFMEPDDDPAVILGRWLIDLESFHPRDWILENFTIEKRCVALMDLFTSV